MTICRQHYCPYSSVQQAICDCFRMSLKVQTVWYALCINCKWLAHEKCAEPLSFQVPCNLYLALSVADLDEATKSRFAKLTGIEKHKVVVCILCKKCIKVLKAHGVNSSLPLPALPHTQPMFSKTKFPWTLVCELQHLVAFHYQILNLSTIFVVNVFWNTICY